MPVSPAAPLALSGGKIDACEDAIVEAVGMAIADRHVGEFGLQTLVGPERGDRDRSAGGRRDLEHGAADAVAGGEEDAIGGNGNRLGDLGIARAPTVTPENEAVG